MKKISVIEVNCLEDFLNLAQLVFKKDLNAVLTFTCEINQLPFKLYYADSDSEITNSFETLYRATLFVEKNIDYIKSIELTYFYNQHHFKYSVDLDDKLIFFVEFQSIIETSPEHKNTILQ